MNVTQLRYLVTLAESTNATQAARDLNITRPALTNGIHQLEDELNIKLVTTSNNKISLTDQGKIAVAQAKIILSDVKTLYQLVGNQKDRVLKIGILSNIQPIMNELSSYEGQVNLSFQKPNELVQSVQNGQLDLAFTAFPNSMCPNDPQLHFDPVFDDHLGAFVISDNPLVAKHSLSYQDLQRENIIISHDHDNEQFIQQIIAKHGPLHIVFSTPGINLVHHIMDNETVLIGRKTQLDYSPDKDTIKLVELPIKELNQITFSFGWLYLDHHQFSKDERALIRRMTAGFY
ncbi:MAG: LysR family transcriptional regulator [Candidatus Limosilactobacillus merdavium]|uniref:LysR family transcriptional regulator n=1 Tax=Candidatus Limosilactobacillus merdavium TaxID=2838651 RepID=A0A9E2KT32_9LACO|nr:LysR family transcriptional regulator [Candidatus Limosilactobacillus merdavium]